MKLLLSESYEPFGATKMHGTLLKRGLEESTNVWDWVQAPPTFPGWAGEKVAKDIETLLPEEEEAMETW